MRFGESSVCFLFLLLFVGEGAVRVELSAAQDLWWAYDAMVAPRLPACRLVHRHLLFIVNYLVSTFQPCRFEGLLLESSGGTSIFGCCHRLAVYRATSPYPKEMVRADVPVSGAYGA
jgi:hypothetical protein